MGLPFDQHFAFPDNPVTEHIQALYELANQGQAVQAEIDRYWIALTMLYTNSPLLKELSWEHFVLKQEHVLTCNNLPDIGRYIRMLSTKSENTDIMCRMIQYSLPYIKHNRLSFAKFEDVSVEVLVDLLLILQAMCLGLHSASSKKPVWRLRLRMVAYLHCLMSSGSAFDLYLFCTSNINLIRIAIVEYFVFFVQHNMPCEYEMLRYHFGLQTDIQNICVQFRLNINHFRSYHLQTDTLSWTDLNEKAHVIIEKCNRICKGKPRLCTRGAARNLTQVMSQSMVHRALHMPKFHHISHALQAAPDLTLKQLKQTVVVQNFVKCHVLPKNITRIQCQHLYRALYQDTEVYSRCMLLFQCMGCRAVSSRNNSQLRVSASGNVSCCHCDSSETVVNINLLGRVAQVSDKKYYFCFSCLAVHEWKSSGREFAEQCCYKKQTVSAGSRECMLCSRIHNLNEFTVLDDTYGVMHHIILCGRHMPWQHQIPGIYNFETFNKAIQMKLKQNQHI